MNPTRRLLIALLILGSISKSAGGPLSLCVIPIADILRHKEIYLEYTAVRNERNIDAKTYQYNSVNIGLFNRAEIGIDQGTNGECWYHGEVQILENQKFLNGAVTIGIQNIGRKGYCEPYVVGSFEFKGYRLHAGMLRMDTWRTIAGIDSELGDWTLAADFTSGRGGLFWSGAAYSLPKVPGMALGFYVGFPNHRSDGIQNMVYASYTFRG